MVHEAAEVGSIGSGVRAGPEGTLARIERPARVSDTAYGRIRSAIIQGQIAPGERVTEAGLSHQLGVSKTPVREALLRLHEVGLVKLHGARGGAVVASPAELLGEALELREVLEGVAAELGAIRATADDIDELRTVADQGVAAARSHDAQGFAIWDGEFHLSVARCSRNGRLEKLICDTLDLISAARRRDEGPGEGLVGCAQGHVAIVQAFEERDPEMAGVEMRRHVRKSRINDVTTPEVS
jgi:DNA-binding GntR family transcriptional regulator